MSKNIKMGWKCPECGTVYAPHVNECTRYHAPINTYVWPPYYVWPIPWQVHPNPYITYTDSTVGSDTFILSDDVQGNCSLGWDTSKLSDVVAYTIRDFSLEGK